MSSKLLVNSLLVSLALAGCGSQSTLLSNLPGENAMANSSAGALSAPTASSAWVDPAQLSASDDPATGGLNAGVSASSAGALPNLPIVNFRWVNPTLCRGGLPSENDLVTMKRDGVKTDIDLMGEVPGFDTLHVAMEKHWAKEAGINFVNIQVPTGAVPFAPKISNAYADAFLKVVLDPANQPCYVHCLHGRDRTGTMVAVYRMVHDHLTNAQALAEMETFGFTPSHYPALANFVAHYVPGEALTHTPATNVIGR